MLALCLTLQIVVAAGPKAEKYTSQNPCISKTSCSDCIQTKTCAWCLQPQKEYGDYPRCYQPSHDSNKQCPEEFEYNPDSQLTATVNKELSVSKRMDQLMGDAPAMGHGQSAASSSGYSKQSSSSSGSYSSSSYSSSSGSSSSHMSWSSEEEIVQIKPQRVQLKLRISELIF